MLNADALSQLRQLKTNIEENKVVFPGTVKATNGRFGFVALDEGRDVFLPPEEMQKVLPGDRVKITEEEGDKGKTQGMIDELLDTSLDTFVGRYLVIYSITESYSTVVFRTQADEVVRVRITGS